MNSTADEINSRPYGRHVATRIVYKEIADRCIAANGANTLACRLQLARICFALVSNGITMGRYRRNGRKALSDVEGTDLGAPKDSVLGSFLKHL